MSILVMTCRTGTPIQVIDEVGLTLAFPLETRLTIVQLFGPRIVVVPKMPSLGLLLENPIFESYNNKVIGINQKLQPSDSEYRPPIDFEIHKESMEKFKQQYIYENMRAIEDQHGMYVVDLFTGVC
jgi:tRNA pseudouridine38-40 synthase